MKSLARRPRLTLVLLTVLLATTTLGIPAVRGSVLRAAGWALVAEDPIAQADVIVTTAAGGDASILEAAELVRGGIANRVAVFADPLEETSRELMRRGLPVEDDAATALRRLKLLGVEAVERIPKSVAGSEEEARLLRVWCLQRQVRSVVLISTPDHSRRLRRMFNRALEGGGTKIAVRVTRYSAFNPDRWWQTRDGTRIGIIELQKLLLDLTLHPIS